MSLETQVDGDPGSARRCAVAVRALAARARAAERLLEAQVRLEAGTFDGLTGRAYRARARSMTAVAGDLDHALTRLGSALDRWADDLDDVREEMAGVRDVAAHRLVLVGLVVHPHLEATEEQRQLYERLAQVVASARGAEETAQERYRAALSVATGISPPSGGPAGWSQEDPPAPAPAGLDTELNRAIREILEQPPVPPPNPGLPEPVSGAASSEEPPSREERPRRPRPPEGPAAPGEPGAPTAGRDPGAPAARSGGDAVSAPGPSPAAPWATVPLPTLAAVALTVGPALPTLAAVLHPPPPSAVLGGTLASDPP